MKIYLLIISILIGSSALSQSNLNESINKVLDSYVKSDFKPGLTVGIVKNGDLIFHANKGYMNLEYNLPFNDSTVFGLASVTKQFTSACIGVLEKQGKLSINDHVRKHIPELVNYEHTIRIIHLLNHTSGIRNHNVLLDLKGFDYEHQGYTNKMIQELMFKQKNINNKPGSKMLYSNTNYVLLALIVERVSGMQIHKFAKEELFDPLQMTKTFYQSDLKDIIENRAYSYYEDKGKYQQPKSLTLCVGAGGVGSTVIDLAKWSDVYLNPNHPFSYLKGFITQQDTLNNGELMKHARGMFVSPYKGHDTFNHSGRDLGMRSQFICIPEKNLAIIVFTNSENINAINISYQILDLFLDRNSHGERTKKQYQHSAKQMKGLQGTYQELNSDLRMDIFVENDTLKAMSSFGRNATALVSQSVNSLCRINNASVVYTFQTEEISDVDLYVDFGGAIFYFERVELEEIPNQNLDAYTGNYYSNELDVNYRIFVADDKLVLSYPNNENMVIKEGVKDTFGANRRTKYSFNRNGDGKVISFEVASEGTVKDILFERIN